ncbi:hypothetical protein [Moraxella catarrhalis]|uniref:hypothetical protein n=1 Tax=Moraxella catarrhalis TaxID=480 RepID=UPI0015609832|nr:hypothetical protein [Moraxella catarrhalis]
MFNTLLWSSEPGFISSDSNRCLNSPVTNQSPTISPMIAPTAADSQDWSLALAATQPVSPAASLRERLLVST